MSSFYSAQFKGRVLGAPSQGEAGKMLLCWGLCIVAPRDVTAENTRFVEQDPSRMALSSYGAVSRTRERSRKTTMKSDHWSNKEFIVDLIGELAGVM